MSSGLLPVSEILWNRINPFGARESLPNMLDILYRAATLNSDLLGRQSRQMAERCSYSLR